MRRMRDFSWQYLLFAVPAVVAALGIQYLMHKNYPDSGHTELATVMKPSQFKSSGDRHVASAKHDAKVIAKKVHDEEVAEEQEPSTPAESMEGLRDLASHGHEAVQNQPDSDDAGGAPLEKDSGSSHHADVALDEPVGGSGGTCGVVEYKGDGPKGTKITQKEWNAVMDQFHSVKEELLAWLDHHRKEFPDKTGQQMEMQIRRLKIQRPPAAEEPDLSWRGVGVLAETDQNTPIIRIGGGFVKLVVKQPRRARFEMARLVAQSWAPCELDRIDASGAWAPLMACMNVHDDNACAAGTYSEGGWAVSSALAAIVADPGCAVPAFKGGEMAKCLKKVPLPLSLTQNGFAQGVKEASK